MTDHLHLADHLNHPEVQAALQKFADRLTMQACQDCPPTVPARWLEHVEDTVSEAVEDAVRSLAVEGWAEWPEFRGVAGL